jgi:hypothetical protein
MTRRGTGSKIKKKKKDPADKSLARATYATSCFGTRAIPLLRSFFRALQSLSKSLADGYFFLRRLAPTTPHSTLADRGFGSITYSIGSGSAPRRVLVGQYGYKGQRVP